MFGPRERDFAEKITELDLTGLHVFILKYTFALCIASSLVFLFTHSPLCVRILGVIKYNYIVPYISRSLLVTSLLHSIQSSVLATCNAISYCL